MRNEDRYRCNSYVHCFVNGRFVCECGSEWYDSVLTEMILALSTVEGLSVCRDISNNQ